jgi:thiamine biosynthesis lipoprotein
MVLNPSSLEMVNDRVQRSASRSAKSGYYQLTFQAMSTVCRVNIRTLNPTLAQDFQGQVLRWVAEFEARYSRFIPDSIIGCINAAAGKHWVEVDAETDRMLSLCQEVVFFTRGAFDPTALPLIRLWNWKAQPPVVPDAATIRAAQELVGWRKIQRRPGAIFLPVPGMCLDLGGIGKEYAVDQVVQMALARGIEHVLVDFGQDVRVHGQPPEQGAWHIGLEDPLHPGKCWAGVAVSDHAVATSGDYLRNFFYQGRRYGHIIDPRTGQPVDNGCLSVSVIAPSCTMAGVLSTTAFVLGPREGLELIQLNPGVEACITTHETRYTTRKFYAYVVS